MYTINCTAVGHDSLDRTKRTIANTFVPHICLQKCRQLTRELDISARSVQIWLAHAFVYTTCIISIDYFLRFQNKMQSGRQGGRNPADGEPGFEARRHDYPDNRTRLVCFIMWSKSPLFRSEWQEVVRRLLRMYWMGTSFLISDLPR
jgi:hypothetical protein